MAAKLMVVDQFLVVAIRVRLLSAHRLGREFIQMRLAKGFYILTNKSNARPALCVRC